MTRVAMTGLAFGESPRWHDGRIWFANWGTQQIVAVDGADRAEVTATVPTTIPYCFDWHPDGRLLVVSGQEQRLLQQASDGSFTTLADVAAFGAGPWNEIVVDGRGNAYVNGPGIAVVARDGSMRHFAEPLAFPNGMAITPDNSTLIVAESHAKRLTAFELAGDGSIGRRRVWAELGDGAPDGICIDAEGAVWYADVPNKRCVRVREGGEVVQTIDVDRGCFACMLGGPDRKTLYIVAAVWLGFPRVMEALAARTGELLVADVAVAGAGWP